MDFKHRVGIIYRLRKKKKKKLVRRWKEHAHIHLNICILLYLQVCILLYLPVGMYLVSIPKFMFFYRHVYVLLYLHVLTSELLWNLAFLLILL